LSTNFDEFFGGVRHATSIKRLDFGDALFPDADPQIFKWKFLHRGSTNVADHSKSCRRIFFMIFEGAMPHWRQKKINFGADPDHDPDPGIFNGIFTTAR